MQLLFLLMLVSLFSFGQQPVPADPQTARVEGTIVDPLGKPLPQVQVRLTGPAASINGLASPPVIFAADTNSAGRFLITDITPGTNYRLTALRPGFLTASYGASWIPANPIALTLRAGQTLSGISMTMTLQAIINGTVVDKNGAPVAGAMVVLMRQGFVGPVRALQGITSWPTGDSGAFRISDVPSGRYYLQVVDRQGIPSASGANEVTFFPDTTNPRAAKPIEVTVGANVNVIIHMQRTPVYSIRGKVVDANNLPVAGISGGVVPAMDFDRTIVAQFSRRQFQTRPDGTFVINGLAPGRYLVQANSGAPGAQLRGIVESQITASDVTDLTLALGPGVQVTGRVLFGSGDPAGNLPGILTLVDASNRGIASSPAAINANGYFIFRDVLPSGYYLDSRNLPEGVYIESVKVGREDLSHGPLELKSSLLLGVEVSNNGAGVSGVVRNRQGKLLVGAVVSLWPSEPDKGALLEGTRLFFADQTGEFKFSNLRPGTYFVAAWETIDPGLSRSWSFLNRFNDDATKLVLGESAHSSVALTAIPAAKVVVEAAKIP